VAQYVRAMTNADRDRRPTAAAVRDELMLKPIHLFGENGGDRGAPVRPAWGS